MTEPEFSADLAILAKPARQAPIAIITEMFKRVRRLGAINLAVAVGAFVSGRLPVWALLLLPVVSLALLAVGFASWWRFTFRATQDSLVVTRGVIARTELTIPFSKVQSVTVDEGLLDRLFGLVSASIDTAGDEAAEFSISGIARSQAEGLRRLASQRRSESVPSQTKFDPETLQPVSEEPHEVLLRRRPIDLALIGLLANPLGGLAVFGTLALFADEILEVFRVDLTSLTADVSTPNALEVSMFLLAGLLVAAVGASLRSVISDWDFRLVSNQDGIAVNAGLLRRRSRSSMVNKVQSVEVARGPLMRRIGFARLRLTTIGGGDLIVPGVTDGELPRIRVLVQTPFALRPRRIISKHYVWYQLRIATVFAVLGAVATAVTRPLFTPVWILVPVLIGAKAFLYWRRFRWDLDRDTISIRRGRLFERETGMNLRKVQSVTVTQTFYQRKRSVATVTISNAGSAISIPMISLAESNSLRDHLLHLLAAPV